MDPLALTILIGQFLPVITGLVRTFEEAIVGPGRGDEKLNAVLDGVDSVATAVGVATPTKDGLIAAVPNVVGSIVKSLNDAGVFGKSEAPPQGPPVEAKTY